MCFRSRSKLLGWNRCPQDTVLAQTESRGCPVCLPSTVTIAISHVQDRAIVLGILLPRQEFRVRLAILEGGLLPVTLARWKCVRQCPEFKSGQAVFLDRRNRNFQRVNCRRRMDKCQYLTISSTTRSWDVSTNGDCSKASSRSSACKSKDALVRCRIGQNSVYAA